MTRSTPLGPTAPCTPPAPATATRQRQHGAQEHLVVPAGQSIGTKPTRAQKDDMIYEVNVRGLTENDSSVPAAVRGTYAGAALKAPTWPASA